MEQGPLELALGRLSTLYKVLLHGGFSRCGCNQSVAVTRFGPDRAIELF
jgi:hypothetical protein